MWPIVKYGLMGMNICALQILIRKKTFVWEQVKKIGQNLVVN